MKRFLVLLLFMGTASSVFGQTDPKVVTNQQGPGYVDAESTAGHNPNARLQEVVLSRFEDLHSWNVTGSTDDMQISVRSIPGSPENKTPTQEEQYPISARDEMALGVKVEFTSRTTKPIVINAVKPIPVPGITRTVSLWVTGRGYDHKINLVVEDVNGKRYKIAMGSTQYLGWKRLTASIPDNVEQINKYNGNATGIKIVGIEVQPDPFETIGTHYFYFDDLRATTDLYYDFASDPDDVVDNW